MLGVQKPLSGRSRLAIDLLPPSPRAMENHKNSLKQQDAAFPTAPGRYDDEISLYDLWNVLMRRLPVLLVTALLVTAVGGIYAWMQPVEYEYRSGVDLPRIMSGLGSSGYEYVVERDVAISDLADLLIPETRRDLLARLESLPSVSVEGRGADHSLLLVSVSDTKGQGVVERYHTALADRLAAHYEDEFQRTLDRHVARLERQKALASAHVKTLESQMARLLDAIGGADTSVGLVAAQQVGDLRARLLTIREDLADLEARVEYAEQRSHNAERRFTAIQSQAPVGTGKALILALSVVLGGMMGLFAAFFWEFVANARRAEKGD